MDVDLIIRGEAPGDVGGIGKVNDLAFGQPNEGKMIAALRKKRSYDFL